MSLILLGDAADAFVALDDAGRPLPFATLDFYRAGTLIPATLDGGSHYVADADGVFEQIVLEPDVNYRVIHKTAEGVLRFDVDPWVCTCGDEDPVFRSPANRAIDGDGRPLAGATIEAFAALPAREGSRGAHAGARDRLPNDFRPRSREGAPHAGER